MKSNWGASEFTVRKDGTQWNVVKLSGGRNGRASVQNVFTGKIGLTNYSKNALTAKNV